jgi:signal transduction histidine kinase
VADQHEDFVKNAAHELRTPISAISTAIEVLQSGAKDDAVERERFLNYIHVSNLRRKIESDPHNPERLLTVRGIGYTLLPIVGVPTHNYAQIPTDRA